MNDILVDITRSVSRVAQQSFSGVDRVERAYIEHALASKARAFFLTRILGGYALLTAEAMQAFIPILDGEAEVDRADLFSQLGRRQSPLLRRAESTIRRLGRGVKGKARLPALLRTHLRPGFDYFNTGHSNLIEATMTGVRAAGAGRISVLVHDIIPLLFPEFTRPQTPDQFRKRLICAANHADLLIYNSCDTQRRADQWLSDHGRTPASVAAPLGVSLPALPPAAPAGKRSFVVLGTIEPRKNHLLLLNIWRQMHDELAEDDIPHLHLIGRPGWENENILDVLDRAPFMGQTVFNHGYLSDTQMVEKVSGAHALLFPSFAEGYGYPLAEALALGKQVICSDLPAFREIDDTRPIFLDPLDGPGWKKAILDLAAAPPRALTGFKVPDWDTHFAQVSAALAP